MARTAERRFGGIAFFFTTVVVLTSALGIPRASAQGSVADPPGPYFWDADNSSTASAGDLLLFGPGAGTLLGRDFDPPLVRLFPGPMPMGTLDVFAGRERAENDSLYLDADADGRHTQGDIHLRPASYGRLVTSDAASDGPYAHAADAPSHLGFADRNSNDRFDGYDAAYWTQAPGRLQPADIRATPAGLHPVGSWVRAGDDDATTYGRFLIPVPGSFAISASWVPDLLIQTLSSEPSNDESILLVRTTVLNAGTATAESAELVLSVGSTEQGTLAITNLSPGKSTSLEIPMALAYSEWDSVVMISASVHTGPGTFDRDESNNHAQIRAWITSPPRRVPNGTVPGAPVQPATFPTAGGRSAVEPALAASSGGLVGYMSARGARIWQRRRWQAKAEPSGSKDSTGRKWRCVRETSYDLTLRGFTALDLQPRETGSGESGTPISLSAASVDALNLALAAARQGASPAELRRAVRPVAAAVAAAARTALESTTSRQDLVLGATTEGGATRAKFTLQRFLLGDWRDIEAWTIELKDAVSETVATVPGVLPQGADDAKVQTRVWTPRLVSLVERAKPALGTAKIEVRRGGD